MIVNVLTQWMIYRIEEAVIMAGEIMSNKSIRRSLSITQKRRDRLALPTSKRGNITKPNLISDVGLNTAVNFNAPKL